MFIYNFKLNSKNITKVILLIMSIIVAIFFIVLSSKIISASFKINDNLKQPDIAYIDEKNYTNILKSVYENLDTYIGQTICFTGYVYRNSDFNENQFVLARDMKTNSYNKTFIVGFLCECKNAKDFPSGAWVKLNGTIKKGNYHGEIPILKVVKIDVVEAPKEKIVNPPDDTYIPTSIIF